MATSLVIPQAAAIRIIWQFSGADYAVNTFGAINATPVVINQALADSLAAAVQTAVSSSGLQHSLAGQVTFSRLGIRDINTANNLEFMSAPHVIAGDGTGDALPYQVCFCVTIRTSKAGRSFRGRTYITGFCEAENVPSGQPGANVISRSPAFVNAVGSAISSAGMTPAVLSRHRLTATAWNTATARTSSWSTQRRRLKPGI